MLNLKKNKLIKPEYVCSAIRPHVCSSVWCYIVPLKLVATAYCFCDGKFHLSKLYTKVLFLNLS